MKILHILTSVSRSTAAYRLHQSLISRGIDSNCYTLNKRIDDNNIIVHQKNNFEKLLAKCIAHLDRISLKFLKKQPQIYFSPAIFGQSNIIKRINALKPDIVHLHWICGGMIRIENIAKIEAPLVWTLHDCWAFTGGCHVVAIPSKCPTATHCEKYKENCGECPNLESKRKKDISRNIWKRKEKIFKGIEWLTIVGVSRWIKECSESSSLLAKFPHIQLSNLINCQIYRPIDKKNARYIWDLPENKKIILFGAVNATSNKLKGFNQLCEALEKIQLLYKLEDRSIDVELVVFGSNKSENYTGIRLPIHYTGTLYDDVSLITLYNAADVMIVPSLQESFGQTAMEAMACGTPVVAFNATGLMDIVDHKENGYLACPYNTDDLARGINWILNEADKKRLSISARNKVLREFDYDIVADKYIGLYKQILEK